VPIAIASGALREEVEHVLAIASLRDLFLAVVCIDDVPKGKPEPDGFLLALERLNAAYGSKAVGAHEVLVFEDADVGVAAAHAAGMRTIAIANPAYRGHLGAAEAIIDELRPEDVPQLLG
jgi:phosphoglycolate phosphatase/beta-phosphoglucomutase